MTSAVKPKTVKGLPADSLLGPRDYKEIKDITAVQGPKELEQDSEIPTTRGKVQRSKNPGSGRLSDMI
jgi:hypothetical protein